jgi:hypothetical protein
MTSRIGEMLVQSGLTHGSGLTRDVAFTAAEACGSRKVLRRLASQVVPQFDEQVVEVRIVTRHHHHKTAATTQTREEEWDWARQGMIEELSRA